MTTLTRRILAGAAVTIGVSAAVVPAAFAAAGFDPSPSATPAASPGTPNGATSLADLESKAASAISSRLDALQSSISAVSSNQHLTSGDRAALLSTFNSDVSGLKALAPVIQADTTLSHVRSDYRAVFTNYRVYVLAIPQARLTAAADDLTGTVLPRLTDAQSRLQSLLSGRDSGKDTPAVQAAMTDLGSRIAAISSDTDGLSATLLAYTPSDWNANHALLSASRSKLKDARSDARTARSDIRTVLQAIR